MQLASPSAEISSSLTVSKALQPSSDSAEQMATKHTHKPVNFFDPRYVDGIYIPSALLVVGTLLIKKEYWPFAIAAAAGLSGYKLFRSRTSSAHSTSHVPLTAHKTTRTC